MSQYVVERTLPGAGHLSDEEVRGIAEQFDAVFDALPGVRWQESHVTQDELCCVDVAPDAEAVREHARRGGSPAGSVEQVRRRIDPTTGGR